MMNLVIKSQFVWYKVSSFFGKMLFDTQRSLLYIQIQISTKSGNWLSCDMSNLVDLD
jgi:hypothetical protein